MLIDPDDPWLFERVGLDWRWLTWREAAARIETLAAALGGLESGVGVAFDGRPSVASVLADCALLAAGLTAVPSRHEEALYWLPLASSEPEIGVGLARLDPPSEALLAAPQLHATKAGVATPLPAAVDLAGLPASAGVLVEDNGSARRLAAADLAREAGRLAQAIGLAAKRGPAPARDITVLGMPLDRPVARLTLAWALTAGAAMVTEPDAAALSATATWARPTVLAAGASDLERWTDLARQGRGGRRSPFGRLRAWLVAGGEPLPEGLAGFWRERGVAIVPAALSVV